MRHPSTFLICAVLLVSAGACSRDPQVRAEKYVASGDAYAAKQQNNQALIQYKRAVQAKPDWAQAHYKLAKAYELQGDAANAYRRGTRERAIWILSNTDAQVRAGCASFLVR